MPVASAGLAGQPIVADHELIRKIGHGSYGEVWLARSVVGAYRAVKIVSRAQFEDNRPYDREFKGIQKFEPVSRSHGGLVNVLQIGRNDQFGCFYYVMELADDASGECGLQIAKSNESTAAENSRSVSISAECYVPKTLRRVMRERGALPTNECLDVALVLAGALAHLHGQGLVHRDVKPSNVIFVRGVPKLADIGLVADVEDSRSFVGTEGYVPSEGPGTPSADCYSLGKLLYELSTGHDRNAWPEPAADLTTRDDRQKLLELNEIIHRACAPNAHERYTSAEAMLVELQLLRRGESIKRRHSLQKLCNACKKAVLVTVIFAAIAACSMVLLRQFNRSNRFGDGPPSPNAEANRLCATAMNIIRDDLFDEFPKAYTNFYRALMLDTNFVRPYVGLLELRLREYHPRLTKATPEEMRTIALRLNDLAPDLAPTYCARAIVTWFEWDFPQAKRSVLKAIEADSTYELGHTWYGYMLCLWGYPTKSREQYEISERLRPSKVTVYRGIARSYYMERRYTNAIEYCQKALDQESHHEAAYGLLINIYHAMGDYTNAISSSETNQLLHGRSLFETEQRGDSLRRAFGEAGPVGYWQERWKLSEGNLSADYYDKAVIQINLGATNQALAWLRKGYEAETRAGSWHYSDLVQLLLDHYWDGLCDDPRFKELLGKIGLAKMMPTQKH